MKADGIAKAMGDRAIHYGADVNHEASNDDAASQRRNLMFRECSKVVT